MLTAVVKCESKPAFFAKLTVGQKTSESRGMLLKENGPQTQSSPRDDSAAINPLQKQGLQAN